MFSIAHLGLRAICVGGIGWRAERAAEGVGERSERWGVLASEASGGGGVAERSEAPAGRPRK